MLVCWRDAAALHDTHAAPPAQRPALRAAPDRHRRWGAGGPELATTLGNTLGKRGQANITLVDRSRSHIRKPKLHELAAGSMDMGIHDVDYLAQSHWHHFNVCIRAHAQDGPLQPHQLQVAIIGAGATGVEPSAELHRTTREVVAYGLDRIDPERDICLNLIEAAGRVLPALPERLSEATESLLRKLGVVVHTNAKVAEVLEGSVRLADGRVIPAELVVWAAGIKAPEFLKHLDGLEADRINHLLVNATLQTTLDENVFAMGDCAACRWPEAPANAAHRAARETALSRCGYDAGRRMFSQGSGRAGGTAVVMTRS